ncbi:hypothetical protein K8M07_11115 [Schnuerera sp. xch1]|uniref:hypothetical protein n=1 Tax=Schnuerera sp. xch1 TaxID=2874283 RepID=UPI001CBDC14E|nr:hypothetical protein [Schnuerera sp. xch1]MBZ2175787.1 hypothetical protein [Schnuerera sp. xch1]
MTTLVLWEVSRKQNYIFSSNRLKESIGGSIIVEKVVEKLPIDVNSEYSKNVVYNGGGSSLYRFDTDEEAREFIKAISERILRDYPGVEVFMVMVNYDNNRDKIIDVIGKAYRKLGVKKNRRLNSGEQLSFGIERLCDSTGLPATTIEKDLENDEARFVSEDIAVKLYHCNDRNEKFSKLILNKEMTKAFRDVAKDEKNYMAVVHIDGNGMGQKFDALRKEFTYKEGEYEKTNDAYIKALKKFSDNIKSAYEEAFIAMSKAVCKNKDKLKDDTNIGKDIFPIIPIIVAGDDITYVTNGKVGIETARVFLEHLYENKIEIHNEKTVRLNACAGVAIVRTSYPFIKAYELAEDLCENGKRKLREEYPNDDYSLIDWHVEQGDLLGTIREIRDKNYKTIDDNKDLFMRPLYLNNEDKKIWRTYSNFKEAYNNLTNRKINNKKIARNKIKELREILKKGEAETELFLKLNNISNYFSRFKNTDGDYCFTKDGCMYYDAIEIMDLYIELAGEEGENE